MKPGNFKNDKTRRRRATRTGVGIAVLLTCTAFWGTQIDPNFFRDFQLEHGQSERAEVQVTSFAKSLVSDKALLHGQKRPAVSHRVNYQFRDRNGWTFHSEETVNESLYEALVGKKTARVQYLARNPKVCRLVK